MSEESFLLSETVLGNTKRFSIFRMFFYLKYLLYFQLIIVLILSSFVTKDIILLEENIKKLIIPAFAWFLVKLLRAFSSSTEDINILECNRYDVGPGLASNFWFGFLEHAVKSNLKEKMQEFTKDIKETMIGKSGEFNSQIENIRGYNKLILLLPTNCYRDKARDLAKDEKIFQHLPGYCREKCFGEGIKCPRKRFIEFSLAKHMRKDPATLNVYWIFENRNRALESSR